jgi:hypothetical protein
MQTIQYTILFMFPFLLMGIHNWLTSHFEPERDQQLIATHETEEQITISLTLFICTVFLMLYLAPSWLDIFNRYGLFALGSAFAFSFLIVHFFFSTLLKEIKCQALFWPFFLKQNFWFTIFFIVATELLVVYWLKEIDIYVQEPFSIFTIGYSVLIWLAGIFLGITKHNWSKLRENGYYFATTIIDPLIVVLFAIFLLQILLNVFYNFLSN